MVGQSPEQPPKPDEIKIDDQGNVWEKGKGPGEILDRDGNPIGDVDYRIKMPEVPPPAEPSRN